MLAVRENNHLTINDLPSKTFFQNSLDPDFQKPLNIYTDVNLSDELMFILTHISKLNSEDVIVGRENLSELSKGTQYEMTVSQMRNRLEKLERMGFVDRKKGKYGTKINDNGKNILRLKR
jgi:RIO-like serine/threonine protein kinase